MANDKSGTLIANLIFLILLVYMGVAFVFIEFIWKPDLPYEVKAFFTIMFGFGMLIVTLRVLAARKKPVIKTQTMEDGQRAFANQKYAKAFDCFQVLLQYANCVEFEKGMTLVALIREIYQKTGTKGPLDEIQAIHTEYCEFKEKHGNPIDVGNQKLIDALKRNEQLIENLPRPN